MKSVRAGDAGKSVPCTRSSSFYPLVPRPRVRPTARPLHGRHGSYRDQRLLQIHFSLGRFPAHTQSGFAQELATLPRNFPFPRKA